MASPMAAAVLVFATAPAHAVTADISRLRTPTTPAGLLGTDSSEVLYPMQFTASANVGFAGNPVVWRYDDGSVDPVVQRQVMLDIIVAAGIARLVDVALAIPIALEQNGPAGAGFGELSGAGFGDLRLIPRFSPVLERSYGFSLAFIPEVTVPTGDTDRFLGERSVSFRPRVVGTVPLWLPVGKLRAFVSLGYLLRRNALVAAADSRVEPFELGDELRWSLGAALQLDATPIPITVLAELSGAQAARQPFTGEGLAAIEALGGARVRVMNDFVVTVGGGVGLSQGVGVPAYRIVAGLSWAPIPADTDGDGIPDRIDECPALPEDYDRFADLDGCPDNDNDGDGIEDSADACPNDPEDFNGVADEDGCPDAETADQDGDGILDIDDQCPVEPEDFDGFEDEDGCPDDDHDHDGIPNHLDQCPDEKETINGIDDDDGCPDLGEGQTVYIENFRIDITAKILFESGRATLKAQSKPVLDQVALQILAHPEIPRVRIEGHTDSVGDGEDNLYLSQDRADSVRRYLVRRGVNKRLLEAVGYGESKPIDTNATNAGRARNRRVEFVILRER